MKCVLCGSNKTIIQYNGPIRSGGINSEYIDGYKIYHCENCEIEFLHPFPQLIQDYYISQKYWESRNKGDFQKIQKMQDSEQLRWFMEVGIDTIRNKTIADIGCGAGSFLDLSKGLAFSTIGVEPARHYHENLSNKGHQVFSCIEEMANNTVDIVVCFDTLEHQEKPKSFLNEINRVLVNGGLCYIGVPNQDDFLKKIVPEYLKFFYHTSHLFYFNKPSIIYLAQCTSFDLIFFTYVHKYDIMNMIYWTRDKLGKGRCGNELFDIYTENNFNLNIERQGIASHLLAVLKK